LQKFELEDRIPAPVFGMYSRAGAPLTPAAAAMAQAVSAVSRQLSSRNA
jgi:hypothetical protein